jgi:DNA-binding transcriptional LysR family regulator
MLDFNEVAMFVRVVEAGSFAEAGRRMGVPSNTVSRRVQQLEEGLGVRLLQRTTRKLALTTLGREFFARCRLAVDAISQAGRELFSGAEVPSGVLRVAAPADLFAFFPLEWIAEFLRRYEKIRLEFELNDIMADMVTESIDVALRAGQLSDSTLVARKFADSDFILVASPAYLAARDAPTRLAELTHHDCITLPHPSGRQKWILQGPKGIEEVEVTGRFCANTVQALSSAALAGLGIALLPETRCAQDEKEGRLVRVLPLYRRDGGGFHVVFPSRRQRLPAAEAFANFVIDKMRT